MGDFIRHWLVERALTRALGFRPTLGAKARTLVLACLGVIIAATYQVFQVDSRRAFELAMVAGTVLGPVLAAFVVVGLQADAGRHLVDLQVTLNRIEAADKGKG